MKCFLRALYGFAALTVAAASAHGADDWVDLATVSMTNATTPKLTSRYVCYSDGTDIACNAPSLYVTTGGLVGIGTTNPAANLDIPGTTSDTAGSAHLLRFGNYYGLREGTDTTLYLDRYSGSWQTPALSISRTSGNVGIGTVTPTQSLDVYGEAGSGPATSGVTQRGIARIRAAGTHTLDIGAYDSPPYALWLQGDHWNSLGGWLPIVLNPVGGNVGIGTADPNAKLDVYGTISATNFVGNGSGLTGVVAASGDRIVSGTTSLVAISNTGYISLTQSSVNTGWFNPQTGFVTIGVSSTGGISGTTGYFTDDVRIQNTKGIILDGGTNRNLTNASGIFVLRNLNGGVGFSFNQNDDSATWMRIVNTGNVGIGTTAPQATLQVSGSMIVSVTGQTTTPTLYAGTNGRVGIGNGSPGAPLDVTANAGQDAIYFRDNAGTLVGYLGASSAGNGRLVMGSNAAILTSGYSYFNGGNVGIGTTFPSATLHVVGTVSVSSHVSITGNVSANKFIGDGSGLTGVGATPAGVSGSIQFNNGSSQLAGRSDIIISDSGAVGIATASPGALLDIYQNAGIAAPTPHLRLSGTGTKQLKGGYDSTINAGWLQAVEAGVGFTPLLLNASGGNVGIGTASPNTLLTIEGGVNQFNVRGTGATWGLLTTVGGAGACSPGDTDYHCNTNGGASAALVNVNDDALHLGTNNQTRVTLRENGNLGVGTRAPQATLQVSGSMIVSVTGQTSSPTLYAGSNGRVGIGIVPPTGYRFSSRGAGNTNASYAGYFSNSDDTTLMAIADGGNVGIGRVTPIAKFDVLGTISASDAIQVSGSSLTCGSSINGAMRWNATSDTLQICTGSGWKSLVSGTTSSVAVGGVSGSIQFNNGSSQLAGRDDIVISDTGKIGVGTAYPSKTLDIVANTNTDGMRVAGSAANVAMILKNTGTGGKSWTWSSTGAGHSSGNGKLFLFGHEGFGDSVMVFSPYDSGGNVGIGASITSPTATLQVSGTFIVSNTTQVTTPSVYVASTGNVGLGTMNPSNSLDTYGTIRASSAPAASPVAGKGVEIWYDASLDLGRVASYARTGSAYKPLYLDGLGLYLNTQTSGGVGIGTTSPVAKLDVSGDISTSGVIQVSGSSLTCSSAIKGAIRYSNTSSTLEYCNSTAWTSLGPSGTSVPAFSVTKSSNQNVSANQSTLVTFDGELFDTNNNFASNRFTATIAGKYIISGQVDCGGGTNSTCHAMIYKDGSALYYGSGQDSQAGSPMRANVTAIIDLAVGSYVELYGYSGNGTTFRGSGGTQLTYFSGSMIASGNGLAGGGGTATPAGITKDVQFNTSGALDADTGYFGYDKTNHRLGVGMVTPTATLQVSGTFTVSNSAQTTTPSLYVSNSGRVGLGTSSPAAKLDIVYDTASSPARITNGAGSVYTVFAGADSNDINAYGAAFRLYANTGGFQFRTAGADPAVVKANGGSVGISNTSPIAKLDVNGTISASDAIQVSGSSLACTSSINGAMRWNATSDTLQVCTGSGWKSLVSGTAAAGASAMSGLSDVQLTNLAGRDYLRYDAGTSKWVNISESTVMSTTTMASGWPDAIRCTDGGGSLKTFFPEYSPFIGNGAYYYVQTSQPSDATGVRFAFNADGSYGGTDNGTGYSCENKSIAQLYAAGRAFNFIGGASRWQDVNAFTYLTANNVGVGVTTSSSAKFEVAGLISATGATGAVSTTNLSATTATIPTLTNSSLSGNAAAFNSVSSTLVSATNISTTILHLTSTTLACTSSISGSMRFNATSNTVQVCASGIWTSLSSGTATASTAGATTQVQYNNNGSLGADANFTYTSATGLVSVSIVSTTYVHIQSATTVLACGSTLTGTMRFTSGTVQVCDGTNWGNVGIGVPTGTIMAFAASSCPTGWSEYTSARGRFLRGIDSTGASVDPNGPRSPGSTQTDAMQGHTHTANYQTGGSYGVASANIAAFSFNSANTTGPVTDGTNGSPRTSSETRPVNVAVMFCRYDGYQSGSFTNTSSTVAGASGDVQFNTNNALDAESALNWNKTSDILTITGTATATNISGTNISGTLIQAGASGASCAAGINGAMRWNSTSNTLQVCVGSIWTSLSSSTTGSGVTGGTANYGAVFSGATTLTTDSAVYVDTTNHRLGVGTNAPSGTLMISSTTNINSGSNFATHQAPFMIYDAAGSTGLLFDGNQIEQANTASAVLINYNSSAWTTLNFGGGNVGIGVLAPTARLQVSGTFTVSRSTQTTTPSLYIDSNGKVAIGTTNAASRFFHVLESGVDDNQIALIGGGSGSGGASVRIGASGVTAQIDAVNNGVSTFVPLTMTSSNTTFYTSQTARMYIGNSGKIGISTTSPLATLDVAGSISASDAIQVSGSSLTCSSAIKGAMRYSNTSNTLEYCNSTAWTSVGPSSSAPAFLVHRNSSDQTVSNGGWSAIDWTTEAYDTNNNFDTSTDRFTVTVPGKYLFVLYAFCSDGTGTCIAHIDRNGSATAQGVTRGQGKVVAILDMAAGDWVSASVLNSGGTTLDGRSLYTYFSGSLISAGNGTSSPWSSDLAVSGTFKVSTTAQTSSNPTIYATSSGNVGIGTNNPNAKLNVTGSGSYSIYSANSAAGGIGVYGYATGGSNALGGYFAGHLGAFADGSGYNVYLGHYSGWGIYSSNGNAYVAGTYQGSDARLKEDIHSIDKANALDKMMSLRPVTFKWKADADQAKSHKGTQFGLIAQEAVKVVPELVIENETPIPPKKANVKPSLNQKLGKTYAFEYTGLVPWLVAAVQELKAEQVSETAALRAQLKAANDNIEELRREMRDLKNGVGFKRVVGQ